MKALPFLLAAASCAALPLAAQTPLRVGQTVRGTLDASDPRMEDGSRYDAYVLRGEAGARVIVQMRSDEFDAYLHYGRDRGGEWDESQSNDDNGESTDSRLAITLDGAGRYELRASALSEDQVGDYELSVTEARTVAPGRIRVGQTVEGELGPDDYEGDEGREDHYLITGRRGDVVTVFVESDAIDPYVLLFADDEVVDEDDDGGVGTNAQLVVDFPESREYRVVVRSFFGGGEGAYTLRVQSGAADPVEDEEMMDEEMPEDFAGEGGQEMALQGEPRGAVTAGRDTRGTLGEGDEDAEDAGVLYYHDYTYRASAGERLVIQVSSGVLDPYVFIGHGDGEHFEVLAEDDDGGEELNSRLEFRVPEAGTYTIRVSTAGPDQRGDYELRVDREN